MGLETATYVDGLNSSNPAATDGLAQADDHIRLIKGTIKNTFPNLDAAVTATPAELNVLDGYTGSTADLNKLDGLTATQAELNYVDGVTSAIQTQLNTKAPTASPTLTTATLSGTTQVSTLDFGAFTIVESGTRIDFRVGATVMMSLDTSGNLRVRGDVIGFDTSA